MLEILCKSMKKGIKNKLQQIMTENLFRVKVNSVSSRLRILNIHENLLA